MAGIGIITNPHSKLNKRNPMRPQLLAYVAGSHGRTEITNTLDDLDRVAREFRGRDIEVLAINGGDGTISRTLTAFINAYGDKDLPKICLLGGGTINFLAQNLGIRGIPESVLYRLIEAHAEESEISETSVRMLKVVDSEESNYGFLFANLSCFTFLKQFYRNKTGVIGPLILLVKIIASRIFRPAFYEKLIIQEQTSFEIDDQPTFYHPSCTVLCSTVERMPYGPRIFPGVRDNLNLFKIVSAITKPRQAWYRMPISVLLRPSASDDAKMLLEASEKLSITTQNCTGYTLDGEMYEPKDKTVRIELGPAIRIVMP